MAACSVLAASDAALINIGQRMEGVGEKEELKAFTTAGFGSEYGPMNLPFPEQAAQSVRPPGGMSGKRFVNRNKLFRKLVDRSPHREHASDYQQESLMKSMESAYASYSTQRARSLRHR